MDTENFDGFDICYDDKANVYYIKLNAGIGEDYPIKDKELNALKVKIREITRKTASDLIRRQLPALTEADLDNFDSIKKSKDYQKIDELCKILGVRA